MSDRRASRQPLAESVRAAVAAGVDWVQVRERDLDGGPLLELARQLVAAAREGATQRGGEASVLVNRRVDVALALPADGVHLGFDAMPVTAARALLGDGALLGMATHRPAEATAAPAGLDYLHLAPIHPPLSKPAGRPPLGTAALRAASKSGVPVLAQGGVTADNAAEAIACGAAGVAVTGAILAAAHPGEAAAALRAALDR